MTGMLLTQAEVERELDRLSRLLEETTDLYATQAVEAAEAEAEYQRTRARLLIQEANRPREGRTLAKVIDASVHLRCGDEYAINKINEARQEATKQKLYSLRAQLNALQTISANLRAQT